ncbi:hypothetical protein G6O67_004195 [Ophiocordyceps sinensis]|uniref:Uncharacterized protein n=2 Tax=Ophiocordyceps sinensis TaxID=72228 RepID=A0A8H4PNH3_9HYPO|nr:hypothetical protein OCS_05953 [Ophiocordyceps sinensis CO18]KAF4507728.1 hypothetical protein G6O67_004195 [Ophiocordyceps sinensis]
MDPPPHATNWHWQTERLTLNANRTATDDQTSTSGEARMARDVQALNERLAILRSSMSIWFSHFQRRMDTLADGFDAMHIMLTNMNTRLNKVEDLAAETETKVLNLAAEMDTEVLNLAAEMDAKVLNLELKMAELSDGSDSDSDSGSDEAASSHSVKDVKDATAGHSVKDVKEEVTAGHSVTVRLEANLAIITVSPTHKDLRP